MTSHPAGRIPHSQAASAGSRRAGLAVPDVLVRRERHAEAVSPSEPDDGLGLRPATTRGPGPEEHHAALLVGGVVLHPDRGHLTVGVRADAEPSVELPSFGGSICGCCQSPPCAAATAPEPANVPAPPGQPQRDESWDET